MLNQSYSWKLAAHLSILLMLPSFVRQLWGGKVSLGDVKGGGEKENGQGLGEICSSLEGETNSTTFIHRILTLSELNFIPFLLASHQCLVVLTFWSCSFHSSVVLAGRNYFITCKDHHPFLCTLNLYIKQRSLSANVEHVSYSDKFCLLFLLSKLTLLLPYNHLLIPQ